MTNENCEHVWQGADKVVIKNGRPQLELKSICVFCGQVKKDDR